MRGSRCGADGHCRPEPHQVSMVSSARAGVPPVFGRGAATKWATEQGSRRDVPPADSGGKTEAVEEVRGTAFLTNCSDSRWWRR